MLERDGPVLSNRSEGVELLGVNIVRSEDQASAFLHGRIDMESSPAVRGQLLALFKAQQPRTVIIDLSDVTHIDSSGIATLIEALRAARACDSQLRLQGLGGRLLRLFQSTGILHLFNGSAETNSHAGASVM